MTSDERQVLDVISGYVNPPFELFDELRNMDRRVLLKALGMRFFYVDADTNGEPSPPIHFPHGTTIWLEP